METEIVHRESTEAEKREFFNSNEVLGAYLGGTNRLGFVIGKSVPIQISAEDREEVLNRMMRIPTKWEVKQMLDAMVIRDGVSRTEQDEPQLNDHEIALRDQKGAKIQIVFKHLLPPSKEEGGWEKAGLDNPRMKEWSQFYTKYLPYIAETFDNNFNAREAVQNNLPIDIVITTSTALVAAKKKEAKTRNIIYSKEEQEQDVLLRFLIFKPYPENQRGEPINVATVQPKTNKK